MKFMAVAPVVVQLVLACLLGHALAQDDKSASTIKGHKEPVSKEERKEIETLMRDLLRNIHSRSYDAVLSRISESYGIQGRGDSHYAKNEFGEELRDPNGSIHNDLYSMPDPEIIRRCKVNAGDDEITWPISPYAYYEEFGENYTLGISKTVFEENGERDVFYDVGPGFQRSKSGCMYILFSFGLQRIDGILYWTAMPE